MSSLLTVLGLLYQMQEADIRALADELLERRKAEWRTALTELARQHGCNRTGESPRLGDLDMLRRMSLDDARQIAQTWNKDVRGQLRTLYDSNPRGNRFYYYSNMEKWATARAGWKNPQIAIQTAQTTRWLAQNRFRELNSIRAYYVFTGPPPVCAVCVKHFGAGVVSERYIQANASPVHPNCPHEWQEVRPERIPCSELWVG
jgi:hypothetical protein